MEFEQPQCVLVFQDLQNPKCQNSTALRLSETTSIHRMTRTLNLVRTKFWEGKMMADIGNRTKRVTSYSLLWFYFPSSSPSYALFSPLHVASFHLVCIKVFSLYFCLFSSFGLPSCSQIIITWPSLEFILFQEEWEGGCPSSASTCSMLLSVMYRWAATPTTINVVLNYELGKRKANLERQ